MKKIICLYGGPGSGKSTTCAGLFYHLKLTNFNAEMNREYIKDWVWEKRKAKDGDQTYFFAKQARKERLYMENGMDYIVTDSPLVLTHFYGLKYDQFERLNNTSLMMLRNHHEICKSLGYKVEHYFLNRVKPYQPAGRFQPLEEAKELDIEIKSMLNSLNIKFKEVDGDSHAVDFIMKDLGIVVPFHSVLYS
jgi:hypothetical protein